MYSMMLPGDVSQARGGRSGAAGSDKRLITPSQARVEAASPAVVILSGGPNSVHEEGSPSVPDGFFAWAAASRVPVLGICYGFQLLVHGFGGEVAPAAKREYGRMSVTTTASALFPEAGVQSVWMSHGDEAARLPEGFVCVARSEQARAGGRGEKGEAP